MTIKRFYSLIIALIAVISINAAEVTFDFLNNEFNLPTTSNTSDASKYLTEPIIKDGIVISLSKGSATMGPLMYFSSYNNTIDLRFYSGSNFDITTTTGEEITSIDFICNNGNLDIFTEIGTWGGETYSTWMGAASKVAFDVNGSTNIKSIVVTTKSGSVTCAPPTFGAAAGDLYEETAVALSCITEGSVIYYTIDGSTPSVSSTLYSTPIVIDKETTIKAIGVKDNAVSEVAEAQYTFPEFIAVDNIATYLQVENTDKPIRIENPLTVTYQNAKYLFVKDATGYLQVYGELNTQYSKGDIIPSKVTGTMGGYGGTMQLTPIVSTFKVATETENVDPVAVTIADFNEALANTYVIGKNWNLHIKKAGNDFVYSLSDNTGATLPIFMRFKGVTAPTEAGVYDVEGIANIFNGTVQIFPILFKKVSGMNEIKESGTTITTAYGEIIFSCSKENEAMIINNAGQLIAKKVLPNGNSNIAVAPGFYIVKTENQTQKVIVK